MLQLTDHGSVRELSLDRPPVNALNPALVRQLDAAITEASGLSSAIIVSGRAGMFSAGLDVPELMQLDREGMSEFFRHFFSLLETIARSPVPVVAAVTGHAPAGGAVISLFCDYRIMSQGDFFIGLNETRVGLLVPAVIRQALIRLTGPHRAERLIVGGTLLKPEDALRAGLVDALAQDPPSAVEQALDWCEQQLALPAHAMLGNRRLMRRDVYQRFDEMGDKDVAAFVDTWFHEATQATLKGLLEKLKNKD